MATQVGYDEAVEAITAGRATARALWVIVSSENQRDEYALKPSPYEGPGEYQHVVFTDGGPRLIRLPEYGQRLTSLNRPA